jgi:superfamily II DNA or RNA helicase
MATAIARIFEDDYGMETLIICPKNLESMWKDYRERFHLRGTVLPLSVVTNELPVMRRYRLVIIDESHNLRNREGRRYAAIRDYIQKNESKCILLSATPYNKTYLDLSAQLRLFLSEDLELPIRPENLMKELGETEFIRRHQCSPRSMAAFDKSEYADDWRELMRLFLVRRTRSFIIENYAKIDNSNGRAYLELGDGKTYYFPTRVPRTARFKIDESDPNDRYARLYAPDVVNTINALFLPRYGLGNYIAPSPDAPPTQAEARILQNLSRAGKRLMGFCRTNLFKRLESSGQAFIQSVERHILRNSIYQYAIDNELELPIGTQDTTLLDPGTFDEDTDAASGLFDGDSEELVDSVGAITLETVDDFTNQAKEIYARYIRQAKHRFDWLRVELFDNSLKRDLRTDTDSLLRILHICGKWDPRYDAKLNELHKLISRKHPREKVIVFSQFADTVRYLGKQLVEAGIEKLEIATGSSSDPTLIAWRFSPESNEKTGRIQPEEELRVLIATDVLSEGQNLQDAAIVVNYDLPWAIIRLIQRIGRVDRIGQKAECIFCYSFLPADGVERIIRLRERVRRRLRENAEVVGTDEAFFEGEANEEEIRDLFTEKADILDRDPDSEVDLASHAYQIWKNAITQDPKLEKVIAGLPNVIYSTKLHKPASSSPEGVLVYVRTAEDNDGLIWIDRDGKVVTESQKAVLDAAKCLPRTPALQRIERHHELVRVGVETISREEKTTGGQLGRPSGARFRTYDRLKSYAKDVKNTLFEIQELHRAIDEIYQYPLRDSARDALNRMLRSHVTDEELARKVMDLREADALCMRGEERELREPRIICTLGLSSPPEA